ncbi:alpha-mannosidase 2C1-like isoform X2 [Apostichopus japonicus]|uniref:alpha-mannosidase 2C1-like isoform X2 n=1 Tax=Stichopus japonicus TaxID=307972 RepID=UPI003AB53A9E
MRLRIPERVIVRLYTNRMTVPGIFHYAAPGRVPFKAAVTQKFDSVTVGGSYGPTWSTHWFRLEFQIPKAWKSQHVRLQWHSGSEALIWSRDGVPLQGLNPEERIDFILEDDFKSIKGKIILYIEMACNTMFGAGDYMIGPPKPDMTFTLSKCDLVTLDMEVHDLITDIELLTDIATELPEDDQRSVQALHTVNHMVNLCTLDQENGCKKAKEVARNFFREKNGDSQFTIHAMGHAHIDTAWLWPYAETVRKCARTWSTVIQLMDKYPDLTFVCSQAQQFAWVKENYPALYQKIKAKAAEGRFIPVGGTWVEMDGNVPSGEAFIRQFLHGQRFFMQEFGRKCSEFWLPDTFGYSAQLPQIMNGVGIRRFLTIKISWSLVNKFPHTTFWWQGLDGTRSLSHFPPADNYGTKIDMKSVMKTRQGHKDKGRTNGAIMLYGYSDGGGGPTETMLERIERLHDTDGLPKITNSTPDLFFQKVEENDLENLCTWVGELYLEMHQGTLTSQAKIKLWNRRLEIALQTVEKMYSMLAVLNLKGSSYPCDILDKSWKNVLLNQFHDVLPGSSTQEVVKDACSIYEQVNADITPLLQAGLASLSSGAWNRKRKAQTQNTDLKSSVVIFNPHCWKRLEVISIPGKMFEQLQNHSQDQNGIQLDKKGNILVYVEAQSLGVTPLSVGKIVDHNKGEELKQWTKFDDGNVILENENLKAVIDKCGRIRSLIHKKSGLDAFLDDTKKGFHGNQFLLYDDIPMFWDAWDIMDYHLETRQPLTKIIKEPEKYESGILRQSIKFKLEISSKSSVEQEISLDRGDTVLRFHTTVNWHENHKLLKVEFPFNVHSSEATYEVQFGHLKRPTHSNTSWDWAKYEVTGHKWADMSQHNWGVALLNDCKYGHSTEHNIMRLSLLKSAKNPDPTADMGVHQFTYAVFPHTGTFQDAGVIQAAYDLNNPLTVSAGQLKEALSMFTVDNPAIILETVKLPEDTADQSSGVVLVLRLYEAFGSHAQGTLSTPFPVLTVARCNLLEEEESQMTHKDHSFHIQLTPFQVVSFLVEFKK